MEKTQYIVALEIGSSKIVGAIAEKSQTGYVSVNHLEEEKLPNCVRYGCVQNVENTKNAINRIFKKLGNSVDGIITDAYVSISGRSVHSEPQEVTRNLDSSVQITDEIIKRIINSNTSSGSKDYEIIQVVPRLYKVDNDETDNPSGRFGSQIEIGLNNIVAKPQLRRNLDHVMSSTVKVKDYLVTPLVVAEQILSNDEKALGCMLVDIGAETTDIAIFKNKALVYLNTLPLGGRNLTRDMANGLQIVEDNAELVKKNITNPLDPSSEGVIVAGVNSQKAANYITSRMREIIANINKQISYANLTNDDIKTIVLIGGGSMLKGVQEEIAKTTKIKVRNGSYPSTLNILDHNINRLEYIEIFALLAKGAEIIPSNFTCLERNNYGDGPNWEPTTEQPQPEIEEPKPSPELKKEKKNIFSWFKNKASNLLDETDDDNN